MDYIEGKTEAADGEVKLWTVSIGKFPEWWRSRKTKRAAVVACDYINRLEGFCGYHPVKGYGTLCLFDSENNAKAARNLMDSIGIHCGNNICTVFCNKAFVDKMKADLKEYAEKNERYIK